MSAAPPFDLWRHRAALATVGATLFLIFVGGLVTSTGSGLSVPDWPLSYGMLMPPMVGGVFYEHGHRMAASFVGLLTLVLAVWTARHESRPAVRRLAWSALALVIAQGVLGGLTVIFLLPTPISVTHACLAQAFFCVTIALAYATSREWLCAEPENEDAFGVRRAAAVATGVVFIQLLIGAVMRHTGAGLAVPDFPKVLGRWLPAMDALSAPVSIHLAHRAGGVAVFAAVAVVWWRARRTGEASLRRLAALPVLLVPVQVALGATTVLTGKAVTPTTLHVALGAAVLGLCWLAVLRSGRLLRRPQRARAPMGLGEAALT